MVPSATSTARGSTRTAAGSTVPMVGYAPALIVSAYPPGATERPPMDVFSLVESPAMSVSRQWLPQGAVCPRLSKQRISRPVQLYPDVKPSIHTCSPRPLLQDLAPPTLCKSPTIRFHQKDDRLLALSLYGYYECFSLRIQELVRLLDTGLDRMWFQRVYAGWGGHCYLY